MWYRVDRGACIVTTGSAASDPDASNRSMAARPSAAASRDATPDAMVLLEALIQLMPCIANVLKCRLGPLGKLNRWGMAMNRHVRLHILTLLMFLLGLVAVPNQSVTAQDSDPGSTVNVELILDVSGSMGQATDTGETRMEAAKRVIRQVVGAIPEQEGINVGLRIYGFGGDNTDAGQTESCESSELVAPVSGVDKERILSEIGVLQPTGWTPLALSLERAGEDFEPGENATNAAVLITDGLETCGGDPCDVASDLNAAEIELITHVVGFGVTPEEQDTLGCIAEGGQGKLLSAANADELTSALFDILQELEVVQGVGFIGGTALGILPEGEPGELSEVAIGPYDGNVVPIVARNNTGEDIIRITAVVTARNPAGQVIANGNDPLFSPNLVRSGGISFGYAYFDGIELPEDTKYEVNLDYTPATDDEFENIRDLEVVEASTVDGRVVGTLRNIYDAEVTGPIAISAACFDEQGNLLSHQQSFSSQDTLAPDETLTFQVENFQTGTCPQFLVAGSGFDNSFGPNNSVEPPGEATEEADTDDEADEGTLAEEETEEVTDEPADTTSSSDCADLTSAESVLLALQASGLPIGNYIAYTPETDPNELLGRPGQYISKANFVDTSLGSGSGFFDLGDGGSIEVFEDEEQARSRADYIQTVIEKNPALVEYDFVEGTVLLRVSGALTPDEAAQYKKAMQGVEAC